jgi:hypothetical protein
VPTWTVSCKLAQEKTAQDWLTRSCSRWVKRDAYLPCGSQGLKAVIPQSWATTPSSWISRMTPQVPEPLAGCRAQVRALRQMIERTGDSGPVLHLRPERHTISTSNPSIPSRSPCATLSLNPDKVPKAPQTLCKLCKYTSFPGGV